MDRETCPACGGALVAWRSVPSSEPALGDRTFELVRCVSCGTAVTVGNAGPELHDTGAYGGGAPRLHRLARPILSAFDRRRMKLVGELVPPPARLLDVGAGRGRFVVAARHAGYSATGIEPSLRGSAAAAELGADVTRASIEDAAIAPATVDAVTLWHVLEHLDEPGPALDCVRPWIRTGGGIVVGVPNVTSLQARIGAERWYHLDVPRHRIHFTPAGVHTLLHSHGFEIVRTEHVLAEHNPFGMWQSMLSRVTENPSYLYNLLKRNAPPRSTDLPITLAGLTLVPVAAAIELVAGLLRRGGTIAVLARAR